MYQEEHNIFRDVFKKFVRREVAPHVEEWEAQGIVPRRMWQKMGESGFLCPWLPEEYGGSGADYLYSLIITEELAKAGAVSFLTPFHSDVIAPYIYSLGTEGQKRKWLPGCASGEIILALAMTEPDCGSDVAGLRTFADLQGDHYVINGSKIFISNGINSDLVVVACRTDRKAKGSRGLSLICVEGDTPGFGRGRKLEKMGMHAQDTAELIFEDCRVPAANRLGEENRGFYYLMERLQPERLLAVVQAQAMAEAMIDMTIRYTRERKQFGEPICSFQHNAFKIVDMATEVKLGRSFTDDLIRKHLRGEDLITEVSMAKAWVTEMANRLAYQCVQLHGGYGYMEEYPICRFSRDIRPFSIFAGTTEIMKLIAARKMGLM